MADQNGEAVCALTHLPTGNSMRRIQGIGSEQSLAHPSSQVRPPFTSWVRHSSVPAACFRLGLVPTSSKHPAKATEN